LVGRSARPGVGSSGILVPISQMSMPVVFALVAALIAAHAPQAVLLLALVPTPPLQSNHSGGISSTRRRSRG